MPRLENAAAAPNWNWSPWWKDCWNPTGGLTQLCITRDLTLRVYNPATGRFRTKPFLSFEMFGQRRQPVDDFAATHNHRNYADEDIAQQAWNYLQEFTRRFPSEPTPPTPQPGWWMTLRGKLTQLFRR